MNSFKSRLKHKSVRNVGWGIITLSLMSIFSLGFSSWNISYNQSTQIDINGESSDVDDYSKSITLSNENSSPLDFKFCRDGLVRDDTIVYEGNALFKFKISLTGKYGLLTYKKDLSSFGVSLTLRQKYEKGKSFEFVSQNYLKLTDNSPMVSYSVDGGLTKVSTGNKSSDINKYVLNSSFTYTLTDGQKNDEFISFNVYYHYDLSSKKDSFEADVFDKIQNDSFSFTFSVGVMDLK